MLVSQYDHILVVTSFIVAILASSTALNMAGRVTTSSGNVARIWLLGGSVAMGNWYLGDAFYWHAGDEPARHAEL